MMIPLQENPDAGHQPSSEGRIASV